MEKTYNEIVAIDEEGLKLYTGLSSRQFAIAKMGQYVAEAGVKFTCISDNKFEKSEFHFTDTKSVMFKGLEMVAADIQGFKGKTLYSVLHSDISVNEKLAIVQKIVNIIEWSFTQGKYINNCGPLGTIITDKNEIVMLPYEFYERSMFAQTQSETSEFHGCWTNGALDEVDSWRFTLSAYAYTAITGQKPFTELNSEKRAMDYFDNNFLPLEYAIIANNDDEKKLFQTIDKNLSITKKAYQIIKPQKNSSVAKRIETKLSLSENEKNSCSKYLSNLILEPIQEENPDFVAKREIFIKKQESKISKKRFVRKHSTKITVITILSIIAILFIGSLIKIYTEKPTTEGMSPIQVVETFYNSVNTMDSNVLLSCGPNSVTKDYSSMISSILVTSKMRESYESLVAIMPPSDWVNFDTPSEIPVFGITQLEIISHDTWNEISSKGDTASFTVEYYLIYNPTDALYEVQEVTDTLMLEFGSKEWQIEEMDSIKTILDIDSAEFTKDLDFARDEIRSSDLIYYEDQGVELVTVLQEEYPWLPSIESIKKAVPNIAKQYFFPLSK